MDLASGIAGLVIDFELKAQKDGKDLPYNDSIFENQEYKWYLDGLDENSENTPPGQSIWQQDTIHRGMPPDRNLPRPQNL